MDGNIVSLLEQLEAALEPGFEFPHGTLVKIVTRDDFTLWVNAHGFNDSENRRDFVAGLPLSNDARERGTFHCPLCEQPQFDPGLCRDCDETLDQVRHDPDAREFNRQLSNWYALMRAIGDEFFRRLDSGAELGIKRAEIMLPYWAKTGAAFYRGYGYPVKDIVEELKQRFEFLENGFTDEPIDYPDEIIVEGTAEVRRQVNGVWQHKHTDGDCWHPLARVH